MTIEFWGACVSTVTPVPATMETSCCSWFNERTMLPESDFVVTGWRK
jgi:hypothetical protein